MGSKAFPAVCRSDFFCIPCHKPFAERIGRKFSWTCLNRAARNVDDASPLPLLHALACCNCDQPRPYVIGIDGFPPILRPIGTAPRHNGTADCCPLWYPLFSLYKRLNGIRDKTPQNCPFHLTPLPRRVVLWPMATLRDACGA